MTPLLPPGVLLWMRRGCSQAQGSMPLSHLFQRQRQQFEAPSAAAMAALQYTCQRCCQAPVLPETP